MLLHHDALRLLTQERMNAYLREAAAHHQVRIAAATAGRPRPHTNGAAGWLLRVVMRTLRPNRPSEPLACRETGRSAS